MLHSLHHPQLNCELDKRILPSGSNLPNTQKVPVEEAVALVATSTSAAQLLPSINLQSNSTRRRSISPSLPRPHSFPPSPSTPKASTARPPSPPPSAIRALENRGNMFAHFASSRALSTSSTLANDPGSAIDVERCFCGQPADEESIYCSVACGRADALIALCGSDEAGPSSFVAHEDIASITSRMRSSSHAGGDRGSGSHYRRVERLSQQRLSESLRQDKKSPSLYPNFVPKGSATREEGRKLAEWRYAHPASSLSSTSPSTPPQSFVEPPLGRVATPARSRRLRRPLSPAPASLHSHRRPSNGSHGSTLSHSQAPSLSSSLSSSIASSSYASSMSSCSSATSSPISPYFPPTPTDQQESLFNTFQNLHLSQSPHTAHSDDQYGTPEKSHRSAKEREWTRREERQSTDDIYDTYLDLSPPPPPRVTRPLQTMRVARQGLTPQSNATRERTTRYPSMISSIDRSGYAPGMEERDTVPGSLSEDENEEEGREQYAFVERIKSRNGMHQKGKLSFDDVVGIMGA